MKQKICKNCEWWDEYENERKYRTGNCRRFPPLTMTSYKGIVHPIRKDDDWCGEYKPKKK